MQTITAVLLWALAGSAHSAECPAFLDYELRKLHATETVNLCTLSAGKPLLLVNTASRCGYVGQFKGLEILHQTYADQGLVVVGFPSHDFRQEVRDEETAATVCFVNHGVTFTMIAPSGVTGERANPIFQELARQSQAPQWNFHKYLLNPQGDVVGVFPASVSPSDPAIKSAIEDLL